MRLSITTRELVASLARPVQRVMREVAGSLGSTMPESAARMAEEPLAAMPDPQAWTETPERRDDMETPAREERPSTPTPEALRVEGTRALAPLAGEEEPSAATSAPIRRPVLVLRPGGRVDATVSREEVMSGSTVSPRDEAHRPSVEVPGLHLEPSGRSPTRTRSSLEAQGHVPVPEVPRLEGARPVPPVAEEEQRSAPISSRARRPVLVLRPRERVEAPVAREHVTRGSPDLPRLAVADKGAPSRPELAEAPAPETRPVLALDPVPVRLAEHVVGGLVPVWDEAHRLTHELLTVERPTPPPSAGVSNTFNVSVHLEPAGVNPALDRTTLEDALVDVLRDAARRHGLEV